ncbi:MAG TPA: hypothetical protein VEQ65_13290, partial [Opitutus sp.]|nr:hypothetical protein [Opitutus sp.]
DAPTPSASAGSPGAASAPISPTANASAPLIPPISLAPGPDPRVQDFLDAIRVTGIRSSGNESKVLMNERVYRVNDIVDRTLQLKLIKVSADSLTFSDANGVTYTRNF